MGAMLNQNFTLKDGLSATVTIPIQQKENVLMVPNRAITRQAGNATVQVVKDNNTATPEVVSVKTGLTDGSNTEITSGLNEGDQVLVKASSSSGSFRGGPMIFGP
jgi:multidrug efflux pump subunit AcrA (membrane-fusion protein)